MLLLSIIEYRTLLMEYNIFLFAVSKRDIIRFREKQKNRQRPWRFHYVLWVAPKKDEN